MYFANMFCYGFDNDIVGITGIVGCIGVIYVGQGNMYAIHIPDGGADENLHAGKVFSTWVKNQQGAVGKGHGHLFVFVNGTNRSVSMKGVSTAEQEAKAIKKALKSPPTVVYRLMKNLGPGSGGAGANSAAIMLERVHVSETSPTGCIAWYKQDFNKITWVNGGKAETAQYKVRQAYQGAKVPSDLSSGWWRVSDITATATVI